LPAVGAYLRQPACLGKFRQSNRSGGCFLVEVLVAVLLQPPISSPRSQAWSFTVMPVAHPARPASGASGDGSDASAKAPPQLVHATAVVTFFDVGFGDFASAAPPAASARAARAVTMAPIRFLC